MTQGGAAYFPFAGAWAGAGTEVAAGIGAAATAGGAGVTRSGHTWEALVWEVHPHPCGGRFDPAQVKARSVGQRLLTGL